MSHFSVMVIGPKNHDELAAAMAPYQENNMGDCPAEFLEFHDIEEESLKQYQTKGTEMVRSPNGELFYPWDDRFKVCGSSPLDSTQVIPGDYIKVNVPHKERFATFEEFMAEYEGDEARDEKAGRYGYWENPNRKWDWWELGGRWEGFLLVNAGATGIRGKGAPYGGDPLCENDPLRVDAARHGDINWEGMMKAMAQAAGKRWDKEMQRVAQADKTAEAWRAEFFSMDDERKGRFARMLESTGLTNTVDTYRLWALNRQFFTGVNLLLDRDRGSYVAKNSVPSTFAYLKDGKWGERGEMGWFGCVADEKDCTTWENEFEQMLETLSPDTMIWIVDCHI